MDFEKSSIERLKRTLYSRNEAVVPKEKRTPVQGHESSVPTDWGSKPTFGLPPEDMKKSNNTFFNKFLIGSLGFFVVAFLIAMFVFFGGINMISSNNLDVKITAPSSVSSGEELPIDLSIVNGNRTDLEEVSLFITYPEGAQSVGVTNKPLTRETINLGTIEKGSSGDYSVRALLFGEKDSVKTFTFKIEYKVKGSNAVFSKEKSYDVLIGSSPMLLKLSYPKEVNSGQLFTLSVEVTSNSSVVIKNPIVKVEYPYGFTYKDSNISPLQGNALWNIGDLKDGDKKILTIRGTLVGQNLEDRSFRVSAGTQSLDKSKDFDATLVSGLATVGIRKSFFDLSVSVPNGAAVNVGQVIPVTIKWQNTLPDKIINNYIEATLSGTAFDRGAVSVSDGGFYRSVDNTLIWDKNSINSLQSMMPGDSGDVAFSVGSLGSTAQTRGIKNPYINIHVVMKGDRAGIDVGGISSSEDYIIKINSTPSIVSKSNRAVGPFSNTGPIPPRADKESTYTITWTLTNTTNDLKDTVVSATLPVGVVWKNETSPVGEIISYNSDTRVVSWNAGNVASGVGFSSSSREVSFKVALTPNINQVGSPAVLLGDTGVQLTDTYTGSRLTLMYNAVTTRYLDPSFLSGNDVVVK